MRTYFRSYSVQIAELRAQNEVYKNKKGVVVPIS